MVSKNCLSFTKPCRLEFVLPGLDYNGTIIAFRSLGMVWPFRNAEAVLGVCCIEGLLACYDSVFILSP